MGVAQISQSAIQQTTSSWCQGVILSALHKGHPGSIDRRTSLIGRAAYAYRVNGVTGATNSPPPRSGQGYLVFPDSTPAPALLALHSWWGLTPAFRELCDRFADAGFVVLAPDLLGGITPQDQPEASLTLAEMDVNRTAGLILSSAATLRMLDETPDSGIGVIGLSMGASWGLWLASRAPEQVDALSFFYGSQDVDRLDIGSPVLGHFAEHDDLITTDEAVVLEASLMLSDRPAEIHHYPGTSHWFMESDRPEFDAAAADVAFDRTCRFLLEHLEPKTS